MSLATIATDFASATVDAPNPAAPHVLAPASNGEPRLLRVVPSEPPYVDDGDGTDSGPPVTLAPPWSGLLPLPKSVPPRPSPHRIAAVPAIPAPPRSAAEADETDAMFAARRTPRAELPDPRPRAAAAIRILLEVLAGDRPARQVASWVSPPILDGLERRPLGAGARRPRRTHLQSLHLAEPSDAVAEVAAVISSAADAGARRRAVALRLEGRDGRWVVTAFTLG